MAGSRFHGSKPNGIVVGAEVCFESYWGVSLGKAAENPHNAHLKEQWNPKQELQVIQLVGH